MENAKTIAKGVIPDTHVEHVSVAAVLHDAVEDHPDKVTFKKLVEDGFSDLSIDTIRRLTKMPGETPEEYIERIAGSVYAVIGKLADLKDNTDITRLKGVTEKDFKRMQKYHGMWVYLNKVLVEYINGTRDINSWSKKEK